MQEVERFYPKNQTEWRQWLQENHLSKQSVWLIFYKKKSAQPTITWSESVDQALCFGWIDSVKKKLDEERSIQFFSKRKPKSTWSKINKAKVDKLIIDGMMTQAGRDSIEIAKRNGSWTILDDVEDLIIPNDLEAEFAKNPDTKDCFLSLSKSVRKMMLYQIISAKQQATRQKRISEIVELVSQRMKPK